jgi:hypothetical protein
MMRTSYLPLCFSAVAALLCLSSCTGGRESSVKVYDIGTRVEVGHIIYTVFETQWLPQIGTGDTARVPKNRFFLVRLSAVDSGSEDLYVPNMTLLDDQGNASCGAGDHACEELEEGDGVPQWIGYLRNVKPAEAVSGNVVFDAQPKHYRLRVTDEDGRNPALIDIPLSFSAETPQLPLPTINTPDFRAPGKK